MIRTLKHRILFLSLLMVMLCFIPWAGAADKKLKVVAANQDLASLAQYLGGNKVEVIGLGKGYQNPHFIPPKPSYIVQLKDADLVVRNGMELDIWLDPLILNARNPRIIRGAQGYVDTSVGIPVLGAPIGKIDRSLGDVHPYGNPHYWLDPVNAKYMSASITAGLQRVDPENSAYYGQMNHAFLKQLASHLTGWINRAKPLKGINVVTYHASWNYLAERFGLIVVGTIEPKPGLPPTARHTKELMQIMQTQHVKLIMIEPFYNRAVPDQLASATGAKVVVIPPSVGGLPEVKDYFGLFDTILTILLKNI